MSKRVLGWAGLILLIAECLLIILSWLLSATMMEDVRSLLSSEGIRWLFGSYTSIVASPLLVWLLLLLIAGGAMFQCDVFKKHQGIRDRLALRVSSVFIVIYLIIIVLLTLTPHAILLSATGDLFPSAFSRSLIPLIAFGIILFSVTYGVMAGRMSSLSDILEALSYGIRKGAPLIVLYILFIQFIESLWFVFGAKLGYFFH